MAIITHLDKAIEVDVSKRIEFSDAALSLAGHSVTDEELRAIERRFVAGEISIEEALELGARRIDTI